MLPTRTLITLPLLVLLGCNNGSMAEPFTPGVDEADARVEETNGFTAAADDAGVLTDTAVTPTDPDAAVAADTAPAVPGPTDSATAVPAPVDSGAAVDAAPAPVPPPPPVSKTEYAPYFYSWGWGNSAYPFTSLVDMQKKAGIDSATLAFVLARSGTCEASRTIPNQLADINAFRAAGGTVKTSFGGASGTYLEAACTSSTALANALSAFVDETNLRDLDFDVEQDPVMTSTVNARRAAALATVQASKGVKIAFTLAVNPPDSTGKNGGLPSAGYAVLKSALAAGVEISHVNLMLMDYGSTLSGGKSMGSLAIKAIEAVVAQLKTLIPGLTDDKAFAMIGATPMIGQNDVSTEVFDLTDAKTLADYAKTKHLGLVSFWAIQRDQPCSGSGSVALDTCSMPGSKPYGFHEILSAVTTP